MTHGLIHDPLLPFVRLGSACEAQMVRRQPEHRHIGIVAVLTGHLVNHPHLEQALQRPLDTPVTDLQILDHPLLALPTCLGAPAAPEHDPPQDRDLILGQLVAE